MSNWISKQKLLGQCLLCKPSSADLDPGRKVPNRELQMASPQAEDDDVKRQYNQ